MGRLSLSGRLDGHDPDLRQARRSLWPAAGLVGGDHAVPRRLGAVRAVAEYAAIDRRARFAGHRRRRFALSGAGGRRRHHPAARARPLSGLFFERHGDLQRAGTGAWRLLLRIFVLALDFLVQLTLWVACAAVVLPKPAAASQAAAKADHRLARSGPDPRINDTDPYWARASRSGSRLGEDRGSRPARDRHRFFGGIDCSRERGTRADHSAPAVRQPDLRGGEPNQSFDVDGDDCDDYPWYRSISSSVQGWRRTRPGSA